MRLRQNPCVRVSAKSDYAVRAALELALAGEGPVKAERIAQAQEIPLKFLETKATPPGARRARNQRRVRRAERGAERP